MCLCQGKQLKGYRWPVNECWRPCLPSTAPAGPEGSTDQRKGNRSWSQANLGTEHTFETPLLSNWMTLDGESNILAPRLLPYVKPLSVYSDSDG